jgi:cytoskeletal protein CcmA (bactofilin family)
MDEYEGVVGMMSFLSGFRKSEPESQTQLIDTPQKIEIAPPAPAKPVVAPERPVGFQTVLGAGSSIEGNLFTEGNIRLDGKFKGTLRITGNVLVGQPADIQADINAQNISIAGSVRGNVIGDKVQLLRTARVWGDITAAALRTEEGAFIDGKISMTTSTNRTDLMENGTSGNGPEEDHDELDGPTMMQPAVSGQHNLLDDVDPDDLDGPTVMIQPVDEEIEDESDD